ncbi:MAG: hypothetical protein KC713_04435 [Candidatus Omnitrophica bacterium]|nr:hypothetical protein [Candidatus Omnitrophota bacterium]
MKKINVFLMVFLLTAFVTPTFAVKGLITTPEEYNRLKQDLREGNVLIGRMRLDDFRQKYGEAPTITNTPNKITYDYGDLKIDFERVRYLLDWEKDGFKDRVNSTNVQKLINDLEQDVLVGENITLKKVLRTYDEPTEILETTEDGKKSIYYYGQIKLIFENVITVKSWKGQNLGTNEGSSQVLSLTSAGVEDEAPEE